MREKQISLFADDTKVYKICRNSEKEITEGVQKYKGSLTLNVEKCKSFSYGRAQLVSEEASGEKIPCKSSC